MANADKSPVLNTLRLSDDRVARILDQRDADAAAQPSSNHRRGRRHVFHRREGLVITVFGSDGDPIRYAVAARNLSETGVGFLHGAFLHHDTACVLSIRDDEGRWVNVVGKVVRCCHLEGNVHEIGLRFMNTIDMRRFVQSEDEGERSVIDPPRMRGRVLCVLDSYNERRALRVQLARLGVGSVMTNRGAEAIALIGRQVLFDVVMTEQDLPDMNGLDLIAQLRADGREQPMMLLTATDTVVTGGGAAAVLTRPVQLEPLAALLLQWLPLASPAQGESTHSQQKLNVQITQLQALISDESADRDQLRTLCEQIASIAAEMRCRAVSDAAEQLIRGLGGADPVESWRQQCDALAQLSREHEGDGGDGDT